LRTNALRRAVSAAVVLAAVALLLGNGIVGTTSALFNGETQNANSAFAGGWIGAPSAATATATGYDVALAWTVGTHGPVTGQQIYGLDNGTSSNCTGAAYSVLTTTPATLAAATATYTDPSRGTVANNGNWYCYEIMSESATSWTAPFDLAAMQLGLVTTAIQITNVGTASRIEKNDTIKLTFNQRTNVGTGNIKVCVYTTGVILLGDTAGGGGCGAATDTYTVGKLVVTGATIPSALSFTASTVTRTTVAPWTMTITLAGTNSTANMTGTASWKLTGSSSILSFATTHQATMCSAAATTCQPTTATNF
jgi:hypothetical protein